MPRHAPYVSLTSLAGTAIAATVWCSSQKNGMFLNQTDALLNGFFIWGPGDRWFESWKTILGLRYPILIQTWDLRKSEFRSSAGVASFNSSQFSQGRISFKQQGAPVRWHWVIRNWMDSFMRMYHEVGSAEYNDIDINTGSNKLPSNRYFLPVVN